MGFYYGYDLYVQKGEGTIEGAKMSVKLRRVCRVDHRRIEEGGGGDYIDCPHTMHVWQWYDLRWDDLESALAIPEGGLCFIVTSSYCSLWGTWGYLVHPLYTPTVPLYWSHNARCLLSL